MCVWEAVMPTIGVPSRVEMAFYPDDIQRCIVRN